MDLFCEKFRDTVNAEEAFCRAPNDECKYRMTCMIFLLEKQREKEQSDSTSSA